MISLVELSYINLHRFNKKIIITLNFDNFDSEKLST